MGKIILMLGISIGGAFGWYIGSKLGGLMTAYFSGVCGTAVGLYFARKINRDYAP